MSVGEPEGPQTQSLGLPPTRRCWQAAAPNGRGSRTPPQLTLAELLNLV